MADISDDPRFREAVELFNQHEFFGAHDLFEEVWNEILDERRAGVQGLIHAAVALHHFEEGNLTGARKMHDSALRYLQPFFPEAFGLNLARFREHFDHCFAPLLGTHTHYPSDVEFDPQTLPQLEPAPGAPQ